MCFQDEHPKRMVVDVAVTAGPLPNPIPHLHLAKMKSSPLLQSQVRPFFLPKYSGLALRGRAQVRSEGPYQHEPNKLMHF